MQGNRDKDKRHKLTKEERDRGNINLNIARKVNYVESVKAIYIDLLSKLFENNYSEEQLKSDKSINKVLIPYVMQKYNLAEQTAADYIGKAKTLALVNVNTSEYAQQVLKKNFLRLERLAEKAYQEDDSTLELKVIDMENKLFQLYVKPSFEIETNPQEGTTRFRINLGGEDN